MVVARRDRNDAFTDTINFIFCYITPADMMLSDRAEGEATHTGSLETRREARREQEERDSESGG